MDKSVNRLAILIAIVMYCIQFFCFGVVVGFLNLAQIPFIFISIVNSGWLMFVHGNVDISCPVSQPLQYNYT